MQWSDVAIAVPTLRAYRECFELPLINTDLVLWCSLSELSADIRNFTVEIYG